MRVNLIKGKENEKSKILKKSHLRNCVYIKLATIINKVSQMFSEISSTYLQVLMNKKAVNYTPPFRIKQNDF